MHVQEMYRRLTGLVVFRRLLQDPVVAACGEMLSARVRGDSGDFSAACAGFEAALFQSSDSWSCYLREAVLESENVCIRGQAVGRSSVLQESLRRELAFFDQLSQLQLEDLTAGLREPPEFLVGWVVSPTDITREYLRRMEEVGVKGYGIFARYHVFTVEEGQLAPVKHPDPQRLEELPGYEREREKVIANTRALLEGKPANNVLLYGMNVQQAINEPRAMAINRSGMDSPARVSIEQPRFDPDLVAQMEGIGYEMKDVGEYNMAVGGIAAIYLDRDNGIFYAGADPRRGYKALAY